MTDDRNLLDPESPAPFATPLLYAADMEQPEPDESATAQAIVHTMRKISETTFKDYGHAVRSVHAKSHGLLRGEFRVLDHLPAELAQGLFANAMAYPVVMRLSTTPGDILDDSISTPRGLAVKVIGVEGERLPGSEKHVTQDFLLVNGPAFIAANAKAFLSSLRLLAATTDTPQFLKKALSAVLRGAESVVETFGGESGTLKSLGGHPETHILGETFFSQAPILFGPYMAKVMIAPISPGLVELMGAPLNVNGKPNGLRDAVVDFFSTNGGEWEVRVQLRTNAATMPIEDASVPWPEDESPYRVVARISVEPQEAWSEAREHAMDDGLAFTPWNGLAAHRPLGSIMRVRKAAYEMSSRFRSDHNSQEVSEPTSIADLPA